ncbi:sulfite exporter TauE/SafE family protein [Thiothrix winogradskyi]|uniref:Sulfite exporter TauE/SafE family protein n=1 Tax=Thiothrix winogradskyi TaxID=96472 RepID=A0ABY3T699_9GAMM|nr:sulfite exporter TauE/SafE family protein [Thiothrix winogradskyi]UJS26345.1 sulfite exporter TauE/SafE family protein [Thiothrix winogradskyi]
MSAASVTGGAYLMLAFGLGTLPNLLLAGLMAVRLRNMTRHPLLRYVGGALVLGFGCYGIFKAMLKIMA